MSWKTSVSISDSRWFCTRSGASSPSTSSSSSMFSRLRRGSLVVPVLPEEPTQGRQDCQRNDDRTQDDERRRLIARRKDFHREIMPSSLQGRVALGLLCSVGQLIVSASHDESPPPHEERDAALPEPSRHAAVRFLTAMLPEVGTDLPGVKNHGMFATHALFAGRPATKRPTIGPWTGSGSSASSRQSPGSLRSPTWFGGAPSSRADNSAPGC